METAEFTFRFVLSTPNKHEWKEELPSDSEIEYALSESLRQLSRQTECDILAADLVNDTTTEPESCTMCDGTITPNRHESFCVIRPT
jgi:hypothetical protein